MDEQIKEQAFQGDNDFDDLDDLPDLFHKSSLKQRTDPELQVSTDETYSVKKIYDKNNCAIINQYREVQPIGKGAFGYVNKVQRIVIKNENTDFESTGQFFAMKNYSKSQLRGQKFFAPDGDFADALQMLDNEINIVKRMKHPNLIECIKILHGSDKIYFVMELADFGQIMRWNELELKYERNQKAYDHIKSKYKVQTKAQVSRIVFRQVCQAIRYMHANDITNRDIKVDNILCKSQANLGTQIKVADFTTVRYSKDDISYFPSGTPGFRGPQHQFASSEGYSCKASDIWSIGYSLYVYYHESFPFFAETELQIDIKAKNDPLVYEQGCPDSLKNAIEAMCKKDWKQRPDINKAIELLQQNY